MEAEWSSKRFSYLKKESIFLMPIVDYLIISVGLFQTGNGCLFRPRKVLPVVLA